MGRPGSRRGSSLPPRRLRVYNRTYFNVDASGAYIRLRGAESWRSATYCKGSSWVTRAVPGFRDGARQASCQKKLFWFCQSLRKVLARLNCIPIARAITKLRKISLRRPSLNRKSIRPAVNRAAPNITEISSRSQSKRSSSGISAIRDGIRPPRMPASPNTMACFAQESDGADDPSVTRSERK